MKRLKLFLTLIVFVLSATLLIAQDNSSGAVYTMSNSTTGNSVLEFKRAANGSLTGGGTFATTGLGTGVSLESQGAVVLSQNNKLLFVVNPGSNDLSVFSVRENGLVLRDKVSSGGVLPISVTVHNDLVYVLNAGGNVGDADNITGFTIECKGNLVPIPDSSRPLSADSTNPAQISFNKDGSVLVVTEKDTNIISTYTVGDDGLATGPNPQPSSGMTPFGFAFDKRDHLIVSEAFGGATDASAVSSYDIADDGTIQVISSSVPTTETAACWVAITKNQKFAFITNTGSASISGYEIAMDGTITILDADGVTGSTGAMPIDMAFSRNAKFLYALNSGGNSISLFSVSNSDGSLSSLGPDVGGIPAGATGLAAR